VWDASDEALVAGMAAGDETALLVLVRRRQRQVFGLASVMLGDVDDAADIAQEAFVRAWNGAASFDERRGAALTWLLAITRNLAIDRLRMDARRPVDVVDPETLVRLPSTSRADDAAEHEVEVRRALDALGRLSDPQRRAVVLAALGGYTAREIGVVERVPLGTAKTRIRDGLRRLRLLLDVRDDDREPRTPMNGDSHE
jgi:RNA polymerase sigma factor (sigma-70 family)